MHQSLLLRSKGHECYEVYYCVKTCQPLQENSDFFKELFTAFLPVTRGRRGRSLPKNIFRPPWKNMLDIV